MSKFVERLDDLLKEQEFNQKTFAENVGISEGSISFYLREIHIPTVEHLVKIADYFQCSTDFLLGREEGNRQLTFKRCPPFCEQIVKLKDEFGGKVKHFVERAQIARSSYFNWACGKYIPSLDNIITLAENLGCRVDYILGRES